MSEILHSETSDEDENQIKKVEKLRQSIGKIIKGKRK